MIKTLIIIGTRPEAIKMAPLINQLRLSKDKFETRVCVTAQHREMLDQVLDFFEISPDIDLNLMKSNQTLYDLTSSIILGLKKVFKTYTPDYVFVHGDTTTTMAASISAFYANAKVCHVEAGLRTFDINTPFPEEMNRLVTGVISAFHFAPTLQSRDNLLLENKCQSSICVTGNTVIDAIKVGIKKLESGYRNNEIEFLKSVVNENQKLILVTGHRRENHGVKLVNICKALKQISNNKNVQIIYPVHLNPNVQETVYDILDGISNINLIKPVNYPSFIWLMKKSYFIITDSGGVQEEAPSLNKPVLVMRDSTERPEAVETGTVLLVGTNSEKIVEEANKLLHDQTYYDSMINLKNPYGDGEASKRIIDFILEKQ